MYKTITYFRCENCGFIIDAIEVKYAKFNMLEYCPRCHNYPQPFKLVTGERKEK